jgi:glycosyltransferase involved in cell wall biosynthesis
MAPPLRIAVAVHGRFHGFDLAEGLHRRAKLERLITTYPALAARRFVSRDLPLVTAPWLEGWRRLAQRFRLSETAEYGIGVSFSRFAARRLPPEATVFVGWSGASLEALLAAKAAGMATVVERGSTHIAHQAEILTEAYAAEGLPGVAIDPRVIERELTEYDVADAIAVGSHAAAATFVARGISSHKLIVNPYGIDTSRFTPCDRRDRHSTVRILFVGRVGIRKGVPSLLRSVARFGGAAELHLVGPVEPGLQLILDRFRSDGVVVHGALHGGAVVQAFCTSDIFCLPSREEGLALVLLQAMAHGLPVVATPESGIETVGGEESGISIVPSGQDSALAGALERLILDRSLRLEFGHRAQMRVAAAFCSDHYVDRAIQAYESLLGGSDPLQAVP